MPFQLNEHSDSVSAKYIFIYLGKCALERCRNKRTEILLEWSLKAGWGGGKGGVADGGGIMPNSELW